MANESAPLSRGDRDALTRLARQRARVAKGMVDERKKVLLADIEDQLTAEYDFDDTVWRDITRQAQETVAKADAEIARICQSWGVPEDFRPELHLQWFRRGQNAVAERRSELRRLAMRRLDSAAQSAKVTIDHKLVEIETELVREGLGSGEAHRFLESLPTPEQLMPQVAVGELRVQGERQPWESPLGLAAELLTPSTASTREERRKAIERALALNPEASDRAIARMAGVDHKTVGKVRGEGGELPTEDGEIPTGGENPDDTDSDSIDP
jgi:hypothetical protein